MVVVEQPPERIENVALTLVAGFLGAGKTTLLNHLVAHHQGEPIGVLVNDFGEIDIDADLVANVDGETITLTNGCICCTIRDDLILTLFRLLHRPDAPRRVIVECSGVSDPAQIVRGFGDAEMFDIVRIDSVVAVVDAEQLEEVEFRDQPLALHQLVTADLVVLNKVDLVDPARLDEVEVRIRATVPGARILRAVRGEVPFELVLGTGRFDPDRLLQTDALDVHVHPAEHEHEHEHEHASHDHVFTSVAFQSDRALEPNAVRNVLDDLPVGIYRAKGILHIAGEAERSVVVQVVGKRVDVELGPAWGDGPRRSRLVAIGRRGSFDPAVLHESLRSCEVDSEHGRAAAGARLVSWIRRLWPVKPSTVADTD